MMEIILFLSIAVAVALFVANLKLGDRLKKERLETRKKDGQIRMLLYVLFEQGADDMLHRNDAHRLIAAMNHLASLIGAEESRVRGEAYNDGAIFVKRNHRISTVFRRDRILVQFEPGGFKDYNIGHICMMVDDLLEYFGERRAA